MRAIRLAGCLIVVYGCASSSGVASTTRPVETVRVSSAGSGGAMSVTLTQSGAANSAVVAHPVDRVWAVMRAVYDSLSIPVATFDAANRSIGNANLRLKRRLGETALSKYINCGSTQGFSSADTYEVFLSVMTSATADPSGGTKLTTTVDGQARPITFSGEPVRCSSLTTLEGRIVALTNSLLR